MTPSFQTPSLKDRENLYRHCLKSPSLLEQPQETKQMLKQSLCTRLSTGCTGQESHTADILISQVRSIVNAYNGRVEVLVCFRKTKDSQLVVPAVS